MTVFRIGVFTGLILVVFPLSGCKDEKKKVESADVRACRDFAVDVAAAYQKQANVKSKMGAQQSQRLREKIRKLKRDLEKACLSGSIKKEVRSCVKKARPRTFENMEKCLPEEFLPDDSGQEDLEEE